MVVGGSSGGESSDKSSGLLWWLDLKMGVVRGWRGPLLI